MIRDRAASLIGFGLWVLVGTSAWAQTKIEERFTDWVVEQDMAPAALVVLGPDGAIIHSAGLGVTPDDPMALSDISKTLAGHCAVQMERQGLLSLQDTLGTALGWPDPAGKVTMAQLLTHTSGFGPDATQEDISGQPPSDPAQVAQIIADISGRALQSPTGTFGYNNENYLVLEAALTASLGEDALTWCATNDPLLATLPSLGPAPELFAMSFAGGLELSTVDLARLFHQLEPASDWPTVSVSETDSYGPGISLLETEDGTELYHGGSVCAILGPKLGAVGMKLSDGRSLAITYSGCAPELELGILILEVSRGRLR